MGMRVSEMVRRMIPTFRHSLSPAETELAIHLRGNAALLDALANMVKDRIRARELTEVPKDPLDCKVSMSRDKELRWFLSRIEFVYGSPIAVSEQDGELPE